MSESTPRAKLEEEVRITARQKKPIVVETTKGTELKFYIVPLSWEALEDIANDVAKLTAKLFEFVGAATNFESAASPEGPAIEGAGQGPTGRDNRSTGADDKGKTESDAPAERLAQMAMGPNLNFEALFTPDNFMTVAKGAKGIIERLVLIGTDTNMDSLKKVDFLVVIKVAYQVIRYNIGPELKSFFSEGVSDLQGALLKDKA